MQRRAENRRRRRARAAEAARARGADPAFESSGESEGEVESFRSNRREMLKAAEAVMGDADEDFSKLENVKRRFESWKREYPATYADAYVPLSAPSVFAPYVRLELLGWSPIFPPEGAADAAADVSFEARRGHGEGSHPSRIALACSVPVLRRVASLLLLLLSTHTFLLFPPTSLCPAEDAVVRALVRLRHARERG